ncbi:10982_t:CDS:10, partial [Racocetra persica]
MTMAPINRFQHPVASNFAEMVFENTRNNDSNSENPICNPSIPQKTKESEKYIREFLSTVRPGLLKKRGMKALVSAKELILQTKHEPLKMDVDDDNNGCESMDWSTHSGTVTRECSFISVADMAVDDLSSLFGDDKKIWMKLLQFEENYRPPYYGTWTKSSKIISGRRPFAKDTSIMDYEYDSDMEWEEEEEGEELKSDDDDDDDPEDEDPGDDGWIVPTGYLSEDEIAEEADESASITSSESSPQREATKNIIRRPRVIEPFRPLVIGPILEENLGDSNHQLVEYSTKFLNANIILPYNPFDFPIANKRKAKDSNIEDTYDKEHSPNKSRSKGKSNQKNKDQAKSNELNFYQSQSITSLTLTMSSEQSNNPVNSQNFDEIDFNNESFEQVEDTDTLHIMDNQYVFIVLPSGNIKVLKLQKDTTVSLGKFGTFHTNDIIGKPFGHSYEIYDRDKIKIIRNVAFYEVDLDESDANNQQTIDDPSKQKLSYQDIEQLKKDGLEGQDIIKKVIESHSSFDKKTEYSKAKYIKRKESKFSRVFTPVRPTLYSVWEYFYAKNPSKIRDMRIDTLSQMLTLSNVRANAKMLVVDDTQGLLITGVMERLGGYGVVLGIHDGENHNYDIVRYMNFSKKVNESLMVLSWQQIFKEESQAPFNYQDESKLSEKELKFYLLASQYQPESILDTLVPYLAGSRPIIIYHINRE